MRGLSEVMSFDGISIQEFQQKKDPCFSISDGSGGRQRRVTANDNQNALCTVALARTNAEQGGADHKR